MLDTRTFLMLFSIAFFLCPIFSVAQSKDQPKPNWFNLDLNEDGVLGVSTEKAYNTILKGKKNQQVLVAVIDGGIQVNHEDLKSVMWVNKKEIAGNRKDDDGNGYADDVHGWNFIGSANHSIHYDNLESVRMVRALRDKYEAFLSTTPMNQDQKMEFNLYKRMVTDYMGKLEEARIGYESFALVKRTVNTIKAKNGRDSLTAADIETYKPVGEMETRVHKMLRTGLKKEGNIHKLLEEVNEGYDYFHTQIAYNLNIDFDSRDSVGDNYANSLERYYGNADVEGPDGEHGTHVAGIVGADRTNNIGIKGVANNVKILAVRVVPTGDERDKDVANGIRYAVDQGAKVINMSFGKPYSWDKAIVDSAVRYAEAHDVLLVHAAGNDTKNNDVENSFPTRIYQDSINANYWGTNPRYTFHNSRGAVEGRSVGVNGIGASQVRMMPDTLKFTKPQAQNWIEVGASSWKDDEKLVADFSNYGKRTVDVFAPGVKINSTIPTSKYKENDGTSMASPVVAGVAAVIRSYYPQLTAVQVKDLIMSSVYKPNHKVKVKVDDVLQKLNLSEVCISGGIVNLYNALELAARKYPKATAN